MKIQSFVCHLSVDKISVSSLAFHNAHGCKRDAFSLINSIVVVILSFFILLLFLPTIHSSYTQASHGRSYVFECTLMYLCISVHGNRSVLEWPWFFLSMLACECDRERKIMRCDWPIRFFSLAQSYADHIFSGKIKYFSRILMGKLRLVRAKRKEWYFWSYYVTRMPKTQEKNF